MSIFDTNKKELRLDVSRYILQGLRIHKGTNYKKKIPLTELVDSKLLNENDRFVKYVSMADSITESLETRYPYLNLEGFTLLWTAEELIDECLRQHNIFVCEVFNFKRSKIEVPERIKDA